MSSAKPRYLPLPQADSTGKIVESRVPANEVESGIDVDMTGEPAVALLVRALQPD